jgi:hypothetical protein
MPAIRKTINRETLFQEILNIISQWPELERSIFCEAHYYGRTPENIACSSSLDISEVHKILTECNRRLHASLRAFLHKFIADSAFSIIVSGSVHLAPPIFLHKKNNPSTLQQG